MDCSSYLDTPIKRESVIDLAVAPKTKNDRQGSVTDRRVNPPIIPPSQAREDVTAGVCYLDQS